jgi:predicted O-methyltransferase YrrM
MGKTEAFERIFADRPLLHRIDEIGDFRTERSALPVEMRDQLASMRGRQNWGVSKEFGRYLLDSIESNMRTLETGAGVSTLIFALGGSDHVAVAPWLDELDELRKYAVRVGIDVSRVDFVASASEDYLPKLTPVELDLVFIDGKHAFPWPILDWYYTADRLKVGGLMILDDTQLPPVRMLSEFLRADTPRWRFLKTVGEWTDIFEKRVRSVHDVAWHEQPWAALIRQRPLLQRIRGRLSRLLRR